MAGMMMPIGSLFYLGRWSYQLRARASKTSMAEVCLLKCEPALSSLRRCLS